MVQLMRHLLLHLDRTDHGAASEPGYDCLGCKRHCLGRDHESLETALQHFGVDRGLGKGQAIALGGRNHLWAKRDVYVGRQQDRHVAGQRVENEHLLHQVVFVRPAGLVVFVFGQLLGYGLADRGDVRDGQRVKNRRHVNLCVIIEGDRGLTHILFEK